MNNTKTTTSGAITINPTVLQNLKAEFGVDFEALRDVCTNANNWNTIQPVLGQLTGRVENFFESLDLF